MLFLILQDFLVQLLLGLIVFSLDICIDGRIVTFVLRCVVFLDTGVVGAGGHILILFLLLFSDSANLDLLRIVDQLFVRVFKRAHEDIL